jgi:signal transduction histidine kinase
MRISSIASLCTAFFLMLCLAQAALVFWSVERTNFHTQRINLAHQSYERHLMLDSHTYQLFKQYGDAMLIGDRDGGTGEFKLTQLINDDIRNIRKLIGAEIELVGEEEIEELEALSEIEAKIKGLMRKFENKIRMSTEGPATINPETIWTDMSTILDSEIDEEFRALMVAALEEEEEEVIETREELKAEMDRIWLIGASLAISGFLMALFITVAYWRVIRSRFTLLMNGVERMNDGALDERINVGGKDEIGRVGGLLDEMAANVSQQRQVLQDRNSALEDAVASRTAELERLLEEARLAEVNRRRLLSDVSHELRTPLTIIQGESEVALRGEKSVEEYREALSRSRDAAAHTAELIDDLLLISRKEEGQLRLKRETTDLVWFLSDVVALFPANIDFNVEVKTAPAEIDRLRFRQSLLALLNNARVYGGSTIEVSLAENTDAFRITVADDGPGLADTEKDSVFQRFFRGSNASDSYREGSGLGLPIVRTIAEAHSGSAGVDDRVGGGSAFYIDLPKAKGLRAVS